MTARPSRLLPWLLLLLALLPAAVGRAQNPGPNPGTVFSRSGQFVIFGVQPGALRRYTPPLTNRTLVRLEPNLLSISCERIKSALITQLGVSDQWRGKIYVRLHPTQAPNEQITVASEAFSGGWRYIVETPDTVEPERLVRALTQTLVAEMATRTGNAQPAEFPAWVGEGLTQLLLAESEIELVLNSESTAFGGNVFGENVAHRYKDSVTLARERLAGRKPLALEQLTRWPADLDSENGRLFQASALLFTHELLALKGGGAALIAALPEMGGDPDWRVGLVHTFRAHFKRILDLEKWWALQRAYLSVRTPDQAWAPLAALEKLNTTVRATLEVQVSTNEPALRTDTSFQNIIRSWDFARQEILFRDKLKTLDAVRIRSPKEIAPLAAQYRQVLESYLKRMGAGGLDKSKINPAFDRFNAGKPLKPAGVPDPELPAVRDALMQLDVLDQRREAWRANLANGDAIPVKPKGPAKDAAKDAKPTAAPKEPAATQKADRK